MRQREIVISAEVSPEEYAQLSATARAKRTSVEGLFERTLLSLMSGRSPVVRGRRRNPSDDPATKAAQKKFDALERKIRREIAKLATDGDADPIPVRKAIDRLDDMTNRSPFVFTPENEARFRIVSELRKARTEAEESSRDVRMAGRSAEIARLRQESRLTGHEKELALMRGDPHGQFRPAKKNPRTRRRNDFQGGGLTRAQAARQRKQTTREIEAGHKRAALEKLAMLRGQIAAARKSAKPKRAEAIELCKIGRQMAKDRAKQLRIEGRAAIREAIQQEKVAAREACNARKAQVREDVKSEVARGKAELREEKAFQREIRRIEATDRRKERPRSTARERRQESDDAVRSNLPAELLPLFEKVKRQIRATDRQSRTEAFLKYAEENEGEVLAAIQENAEREIARLQRDEAKEVRALMRRGFSAAQLEAVPF